MKERVANTDTTYCINKECKNKCWRYEDNWYFDKDTNYWFMDACSVCGKTRTFIKKC